MIYSILSVTKSYTFLFVAMAALCLPAQAEAAKKKSRLTDKDVRQFIQEMSKTTANGTQSSPADVQNYLSRHVHEFAKFKSKIVYSIPGSPPQETIMDLNKDQFMESIETSAQSLSGYESAVKVHSVKIASSGKNATIETSATESGYMAIPGQNGGTEQVPVEGSSTCSQVVILGKEGQLQIYSADCTTNIEIEHFKN